MEGRVRATRTSDTKRWTWSRKTLGCTGGCRLDGDHDDGDDDDDGDDGAPVHHCTSGWWSWSWWWRWSRGSIWLQSWCLCWWSSVVMINNDGPRKNSTNNSRSNSTATTIPRKYYNRWERCSLTRTIFTHPHKNSLACTRPHLHSLAPLIWTVCIYWANDSSWDQLVERSEVAQVTNNSNWRILKWKEVTP